MWSKQESNLHKYRLISRFQCATYFHVFSSTQPDTFSYGLDDFHSYVHLEFPFINLSTLLIILPHVSRLSGLSGIPCQVLSFPFLVKACIVKYSTEKPHACG